MQHDFLDLIKTRRSIYPKDYNGQPVSRAELEKLLEAANYAPTHKRTEPWRFQVFTGEAKTKLGDMMAQLYKSKTAPENFNDKKYEAITFKAEKSAAIISIGLQAHPEKLPLWEELAALGCAVQNMYLAGMAMGIGMYWASPAYADVLARELGMGENEACYGLLYVGKYDVLPAGPARGGWESKVKWHG